MMFPCRDYTYAQSGPHVLAHNLTLPNIALFPSTALPTSFHFQVAPTSASSEKKPEPKAMASVATADRSPCSRMDVLQGSNKRVHDGGERDDYVFEATDCYYGPRLPTPQEALAGASVDYRTFRLSCVLLWGELHAREIRVHLVVVHPLCILLTTSAFPSQVTRPRLSWLLFSAWMAPT